MMQHVVEIDRLVDDDWITPAQAEEIVRRSRDTMIAMAVNCVLFAGIIAATFGLIFWLADAMAVAVAGSIFLMLGAAVLVKGSELYRMLGNAAAIIGGGMLVGGAGIKLVESFLNNAGPVMAVSGALVAALAFAVFAKGPAALRMVSGSTLLMGGALHVAGGYLLLEGGQGWEPVLFHGYVALLLAGAGLFLNVRLVTAAAILPFAQMLDTGTFYMHAVYSFYSPETTLTILQMTALIGLCLWVGGGDDRISRHAGILAIMAAVVANLAFLVGSLWGDYVGMSFFDRVGWDSALSGEENSAARQAHLDTFFFISEHVYSVIWAVLLIAVAFWSAHTNRRGLFNAAITFGGIHAYTQVFETMGDEPLAYALGGLAAIPLAWGMWRLNVMLAKRVSEVS